MASSASPFAPPMPHSESDRLRWLGLRAPADALVLAEAARRFDSLLLIITRDTADASRLEAELGHFLDRDDDPEVLHFPDWETLAYDSFSPHQDIVSQRIETLHRLPGLQRGALILPVTTLLQRIPPADWLAGRALVLDRGDDFDLELRRELLEAAGYRRVETVLEHGEYAVRGALLDIFPMGSSHPYRIDLFDDEIETLRIFDPETQRTLEQVDAIRLLPAREFPLDADAIRQFRNRWHQQFSGDPQASPVYRDVCQGSAPPGVEYYLPLFFEQLAALTDYLPAHACVAFCGDVAESARAFRTEVHERYENLRHDLERPLLAPDALYLDVDELFSRLSSWRQVRLQQDRTEGGRTSDFSFPVEPLPDLQLDGRSERPSAALQRFLQDHPDVAVLFCAESAGRRETLLETLQRAGVQPRVVDGLSSFRHGTDPVGLCVGPMERGFLLPQEQLALIPETVLLGEHVRQQRRRQRAAESPDMVIRNLSELHPGAPVVHVDHGVGRYQGLETMTVGDHEAEFLTLEYAGGARLYVPVASLHLISRHAGTDPEHAPLHRLGSDQWDKARRKAAEKVRDVAAELLDIHARRASRRGFGFAPPDEEYQRFAAEFPFEETPDQETAVAAVIDDMVGTEPMDRLVCGDVGFGKTEVAMRAAFIAVQSGKQVAMLVPTTLLAQQHFDTFTDRFANWPVKIEVLSRFRTGKELGAAAERMAEGQVDIVIGTHKLLGKEFRFRDLGLVIIDEEHRFGVRQKERLKALRAEVDLLTLTATPIPRTLNLAMHELRELSIIATPPPRRLSIRTFIRQRSDGLVKEAILRELLRGGQVFYVHNEVRTIERTAAEIEQLIPEARVAIGHGQMRERELEQVMSDFYHRRANVLVCTTIIETGIDIPNANTIIIDRADRFGLAQLHQLRGRVGRSSRQAYAYLLTPHPKAMTTDARKRLEAIEASGELGIGFSLATHDLEIRGAGELLGEDQSGQMQAVGFSLYMDMLERAVKAIRSGRDPAQAQPLEHGVEVDLHLAALIPEDYLPDVHTRLVHYKRMASAEDVATLESLQAEMIDRFGPLPPQLKQLFLITELKLTAEALGIVRIDLGDAGGRLDFGEAARIDPMRLVELVQQQPERYRFDGSHRLRLTQPLTDPQTRIRVCRELLEHLQGDGSMLQEAAHG